MKAKSLILILFCYSAFATESSVSTKPQLEAKVMASSVVTNPVKDNFNQFATLNAIDNDSNDINQLNRKLQLEKVAAEIRKFKNTNNQDIATNKQQSQTTVTGVAINLNGKKIAWLHFVDGGDLPVNVGSRLGRYVVIAINMNGVLLALQNHAGKKIGTLFLKRVYPSDSGGNGSGNIANNYGTGGGFNPSPITTDANDKNTYVPPLISAAGGGR